MRKGAAMTRTARAIIIVAAILPTCACANTFRGIGKDTTNAVKATQKAGTDLIDFVD
jgi:predicted small secreted protein